MKKEDIPHDKTDLEKFTSDVYYVKDEDGKYTSATSRGWNLKKEALDLAWDEINRRKEEARLAVLNGEKSPIFFFIELRLMDIAMLSDYTGFWKLTIKRHYKPSVFKKLNDEKLKRYCHAFKISLEELKNYKGEK